MDINVYIHQAPDRTGEILAKLNTLLRKEDIIMADLTALTEQVEENTSVEASAVALIQGLADQLRAAGTDPQAIADIVTQLETSKEALAAAVAANTSFAGEVGP